MKHEHNVKICVSDATGEKTEVMRCRYRHLPQRLMQFLFGELCEVLILAPGKSVRGVVVQEVKEDKKNEE